MKRCPECRREYDCDSLPYCLDDGTALLDEPALTYEPAMPYSLFRLRAAFVLPTDHMNHNWKYVLLLIVMVLAPASMAQGQNNVEIFDAHAEAARKAWSVPGMSIAVVQDGKIVLSKGYGIRELGKNDAVDAQTLFGSMSTTKAMVAVAMGILVDQGKVDWDDKVIKHLPDFRIADPYITQELKVRDLFTHNAGLGSTDFLWALTPELPADEAVRRMQYARPAYSFRGGFSYQNGMYLVAGKVIEKTGGMSWENFMTERVFRPLGMTSTTPTLGSALKNSNRSSAHFKINGKIEVIPEMPIDSVAPAGAVWSSADDIGRWVTFLLGDGQPLLKPATMSEIFKPQVILPSGFYPTFRLTKPKWTTYGLGWFQHDYRGEKVDMHTGSIAGRTAIVGLIRDKKIGVYIFGNLDHAEARHSLMYKVFDLFAFNDNSRDWNAEVKKLYDDNEADNEKRIATQLARKLSDTKPSLPLEKYAGTYTDPFYGTVEVNVVDGKLRVTAAKDVTADLEHRHVDTFMARWSRPWMGESLVTFQLSPLSGEVVNLTSSGQTWRKQAPASR